MNLVTHEVQICPKCKKEIEPITITRNSKRILKFLNKTGGAFSVSIIGKNLGNGNFRGIRLYRTIDLMYENNLILDILNKKSKIRYYKITKKGQSILRRLAN